MDAVVPTKQVFEVNDGRFYEITVSPENMLCYYGAVHFLSTMHICPLQIDGNIYASVEHYYQAAKLFALCGPHEAAMVATIKMPADLKRRVRQMLISRRRFLQVTVQTF